MNDTHPTLCIPELIRILMDVKGLSWEEAWDITKRCPLLRYLCIQLYLKHIKSSFTWLGWYVCSVLNLCCLSLGASMCFKIPAFTFFKVSVCQLQQIEWVENSQLLSNNVSNASALQYLLPYLQWSLCIRLIPFLMALLLEPLLTQTTQFYQKH